MARRIQPSFSGGEISPALHARVDLGKYSVGLATCRNSFVHPHGGVSNRPGTQFIAEVKDSSKATRLLGFSFSTTQTYAIELGDQYARFFMDAGQILEGAKSITAATSADPVVVTSSAHGYTNGEEVYITGVVGMTEINGKNYKVAGVTTNTFELQDMTSSDVDGSAFTAYASGGSAYRVYEIATPYLEADLFDLKFTQSADVLTITHKDHAPRELTRTGHTSWTLTTISFVPTIAATAAVTVTPTGTTGSEAYTYKITAFDDETAEEGLATSGTTSSGHATLDSTNYNRVTFSAVSTADRYHVYRLDNGLYGYVGSTETTTFDDKGITPDLSDSPPAARDPFTGSSNYPATVTYYEQRMVFGATANKPQTLWFSQSANYHNFSHSSPRKDDDAITRTIAARQVNEIRHIVPLADLIVMTSGGEWRITAGADDVLTPVNVLVKPQEYHGANTVRPLVIGNTILYIQEHGSIIRDLGYKFETDGYTGTDLSVLANHLFTGKSVDDWCYAQSPDSIVWAVRSDGALLGLTYMRDHEVWAWHRHDTAGYFESVISISESDDDAVYFIVRRTVGGVTKRYVERLHTRVYDQREDAFFVDAGLSLNYPVAITGATSADPVVVTAASHGLVNGDILDITGVSGMTEINADGWVAANVTTNTFELQNSDAEDVDGTGFGTFTAEATGYVRDAVTAISGLDHLEGEAVSCLANGGVVTGLTVSGGSVTLPSAASRVHIGLPYTAQIETLDMETDASSTIQGKTKRVSSLTVRTENSASFFAGPSSDKLIAMMQGLNTLTTGDLAMTVRPKWNTNGRLFIEQADPLPITILAVIPEFSVGN